MKCPTCSTTDLQMTDRSGVEIDYCPKCRGVWLDRGELDKLIERSAPTRAGRHDDDDDDDDRGRYSPPPPPGGYSADYDSRYPQKKKRKSFLGELFDFD